MSLPPFTRCITCDPPPPNSYPLKPRVLWFLHAHTCRRDGTRGFYLRGLARAFAVQKSPWRQEARGWLNQNYDLSSWTLLSGAWERILPGFSKKDLPVLIITDAKRWKSASVGWMQAPTTISRNPSSSPSSLRAFRAVLRQAVDRREPFYRSPISSSNASPTRSNAAVMKSRSAPRNMRCLNYSCATPGSPFPVPRFSSRSGSLISTT